MYHHLMLHEPYVEAKAHFAKEQTGGCLLQLMNIALYNGGNATYYGLESITLRGWINRKINQFIGH